MPIEWHKLNVPHTLCRRQELQPNKLNELSKPNKPNKLNKLNKLNKRRDGLRKRLRNAPPRGLGSWLSNEPRNRQPYKPPNKPPKRLRCGQQS